VKRLLLAALVIVAVVAGWVASQRRHAAVQGSGPLLPLAPMVDAGPLGESGAAVDAKGRVWIWGEAIPALLGASNKPTPRREAVRLKGVEGVAQVALGKSALLALMPDGTVRATGCNEWGLLGIPNVVRNACTRPDEWFPLPGVDRVVQLAAGLSTAYAVRGDGSVWSWGRDESGAVHTLPAPEPALKDVKALALEGSSVDSSAIHYLLKRDGSLWAWGSAYRLGLSGGPEEYSLQSPVAIAGVDGVAALPPRPQARASDGGAMAVLQGDGSVLHFGGETSEMCEASPGEPLNLPYTVPGLQDIASVAVTRGEILAMGGDGSLWRWGDRSLDRDQPRTGCMDTAEQLLPSGSITALAASGLAAVVWLRKGGALAWGHDTVLNAGTKDLPRRWVDRQQVKGP